MLSPKLTNSFCLKGSILLCNFYIDATKGLIVNGGRERKSENLSMSSTLRQICCLWSSYSTKQLVGDSTAAGSLRSGNCPPGYDIAK